MCPRISQGSTAFALGDIKWAHKGSGSGGVVITDFAGRDDEAQGVALQADGKIVVVGTSGNDFAIARYNADGTLDTTFGSGGKITTDLGATEGAFAVIIQPDGKIV